MKKQQVFFAVIFFLFVLPPCAADTVHLLKAGETIYSLSRTYGVSVSVILEHNHITNPTALKLGQKILIPNTYTVKKGDTLYRIAAAWNVSVSTILKYNQTIKNNVIRPNDILIIPPNTTVSSPATKKPSTVVTKKPSPTEDIRSYSNKTGDTSLRWPVPAKKISYLGGKLYGVVIDSAKGTGVKNLAKGTVVSIGVHRGYGQVVFVRTSGGYVYVYGGMDTITVKKGQTVSSNTSLGLVGTDSLSGESRVYFMVYRNNKPIDPAKAPRK